MSWVKTWDSPTATAMSQTQTHTHTFFHFTFTVTVKLLEQAVKKQVYILILCTVLQINND